MNYDQPRQPENVILMSVTDASGLGEFDLIRRYFTPSSLPEHVVAGVGDDCAVLKIPTQVQISLFQLIHRLLACIFMRMLPPHILLLARCAAQPVILCCDGRRASRFYVGAHVASRQMKAGWNNFSAGLFQTCTAIAMSADWWRYHARLFCITIQVHGSVPSGKALRRSGAKVGDDVWVSGTLGDGAAALALIEKRFCF
jgi:thiamine-monophosphate kinase